MKKEHKNIKVYKIWPLFFWHKCKNCNLEFRREYGWRHMTGPFVCTETGVVGRNYYMCTSCAPTEKDAENLFNKRVHNLSGDPPNTD